MESMSMSAKRALHEANALVATIYHQLTEGDAPTINEQQQLQQPVQIQTESTSGTVSPISTSTTSPSAANSILMMNPYYHSSSWHHNNTVTMEQHHSQQQQQQQEQQILNSQKLGHAPLASLCSEAMGLVQEALKNNLEHFVRTKEDEVLPLQPIPIIASLHENASFKNVSPPSTSIPVAPSIIMPQLLSPPPKLQLFGSEYARHLSTSPLAPKGTIHHHHHHPTAVVVATPTATTATNNRMEHSNKIGSTTLGTQKPHLRGGRQQQQHHQNIHHTTTRRTHPRRHQHKQQQQHHPCLLEEACHEIQTGALLDIVCTRHDEPPPKGYYRMNYHHHHQYDSASPTMGNYKLFHVMNVKKESLWDKAAQRPCITAIAVIFPSRNEIVPPGFSLVRMNQTNLPAVYYHSNHHHSNHNNNNNGSSRGDTAERMYLCIRRSREGNPITDIRWISPPEYIPSGYTVVERSPRNHVASFASFLRGGNQQQQPNHHSFIAYRQRLANLEALRPAPLVRTVVVQKNESSSSSPPSGTVLLQQAVTEKKSNKRQIRLLSYYATGGTTVHSDSLGRFHILDRSTHSLISPSAIFNRLSIIESSRRRSNSVGTSSSFPLGSTIYARSDLEDNDDTDNNNNIDDEQVTTGSDRHLEPPTLMTSVDELGHFDDECQLSVHGENEQNANLSSLLVGTHDDEYYFTDDAEEVINNTDAREDSMYERAMDFIPTIATFRPDAILEHRIGLITPILTACYTRHGGAAWAAVNGLTRLLTETDFFLSDVAESADAAMVGIITLLDLTIQAVCDVATSGVQESHFAACVDFVEAAVRYSQGYLCARTVGFVVRFYLFVFYFDASSTHRNQALPLVSWRPNSMKHEEDFPFLFEPDERKTYLSGGSAQSAVLALKELISLTVVRLGHVTKEKVERIVPGRSDGTNAAKDYSYKSYFGGIISEAISNAVDCVERSRLTQLAIHQIHKSGGSELFWHEMVYACGRDMFSGDNRLSAGGVEVYGIFFALLETIIKTASGKIKTTGPNDLLPKDIASKLLSLELLLHTLEAWNDEQDPSTDGDVSKANSSLGYAIRRTVVPCLLWNTKASLTSSQVFRRLIRILSELWCSQFYRSHCKLELAILIEHFVLNLLELGPQCIDDDSARDDSALAPRMLITQQNEVILEINSWFVNDPNDAIDLFLNYDTDLTGKGSGPIAFSPGKRSRLFQRLCSCLGRIAERCDEIIAEQIRMNQSFVMVKRGLESASKNGNDKLRIEAARLLRKASLQTLSQIVKAVAVSAGSVVGSEYAAMFSSWCHDYEPTSSKPNTSQTGSTRMASNDSIVGFWNSAIVHDKIRKSTAAVPTKKESIQKSFAIAKEKSVKKAIEFLTACNVLKPSPREIASFLFAHKERFDPADLGVFLSEGGTGGQEVEHWKMVRYLYIRSISFIDLQVDEGLRHFLSTCGFRLPEEAQKIDRLLCSFAQCFFEDNAGDNTCCPFKDEDTVYLIVFAIIMLNTDLHKVDNPKSMRRSQKKMTKTDFTNNLKNAVQSEGVPKSYLHRVYDTILTKPISLSDCNAARPIHESSTQLKSLEQMVANVHKADALLRNSAVHEYPFLSITDLVENLQVCGHDAALDVSRSCVSRTWHYWYGAVNSCLSTAHLDPHGLVPAVDVLVYGLSVSVCLDMPMERSAFLWQVVRLRSFDDRRHGNFLDEDTAKSREERWFAELDSACTGLMESKLTVLRRIYEWGKTLRLRLQMDVKARMELSVAVKELANGDYLLQDPARTFLQSGNLIKISSRTGRTVEYRFYLFSDVLLYASKEADGRYRIHEDLPLHLMKIVDWFPQKQKNRNLLFAIHHPRKTFHVLCPNVHSRKAWVEDIRAAIMVELERKMANEAARISAATAGKH